MKHNLALVCAGFLAVFVWCEEDHQLEEKSPFSHPSQSVQLHLKLRGLVPFTYGPSLAIEAPLNKYFSLGGMLNTMFFLFITKPNLDIDVFAKAIYPFRWGAYDAAAYFSIPFGLSLLPMKLGPVLGFNFSALPGFIFYFNKHWGTFAEAGYQMMIYPIGPDHRLEISLGATYAF